MSGASTTAAGDWIRQALIKLRRIFNPVGPEDAVEVVGDQSCKIAAKAIKDVREKLNKQQTIMSLQGHAPMGGSAILEEWKISIDRN